jgi:hypothetical protein
MKLVCLLPLLLLSCCAMPMPQQKKSYKLQANAFILGLQHHSDYDATNGRALEQ